MSAARDRSPSEPLASGVVRREDVAAALGAAAGRQRPGNATSAPRTGDGASGGAAGAAGAATASHGAEAPASRDEGDAWYRLAFALHAVSPDCAAAPGIDYERMAQRVQSSPTEQDLPHGYGLGHVRADPVEGRIQGMAGRPRRTARWLRASGVVLAWLHADVFADKRGLLLDAVALGVSTAEERLTWALFEGRQASSREVTDARRRYARAALRECWSAWFREAW